MSEIEEFDFSDDLSDQAQQNYLGWLLTPPRARKPRTKKELAPLLGVTTRTLNRWEQNEWFRKVWQKHSQQVIGGIDKIQQVLDQMHDIALDSSSGKQVAAAKLYLEAVDAIQPKKVEVQVSGKELKELSDEELEARIARDWAAIHEIEEI